MWLTAETLLGVLFYSTKEATTAPAHRNTRAKSAKITT